MFETAADFSASSRSPRRAVPVAVQLLGTALFGAFAIVSVIFAFKAWWPAGVLIALVLGWRGSFTSNNPPGLSAEDLAAQVQALTPASAETGSGNANFDAYRADMLKRLEQEQDLFDGFLDRLREAKDKTEFDHFMDERAQRSQN